MFAGSDMFPSRFALCYLPLLIVLLLAVSASASWKEKALYSFQGIPDGAYPAGGVVFAPVAAPLLPPRVGSAVIIPFCHEKPSIRLRNPRQFWAVQK